MRAPSLQPTLPKTPPCRSGPLPGVLHAKPKPSIALGEMPGEGEEWVSGSPLREQVGQEVVEVTRAEGLAEGVGHEGQLTFLLLGHG